jgi:hypothetical protein
MRRRPGLVAGVLGFGVALVLGSGSSWAGATKVPLDTTVTDTVIAINVPGFATVLANPPDAPIQ